MEELDTPEIARITGLRPGTVRVRLHRARLFLRNELAYGTPRRRARDHKPRRRPQLCKALFASLSDYIDGTLQDEMCRELQKHLAQCQPCGAFLDTLRATVQRTRSVLPAKPDPATAARVRQSILRQYRAALSSAAQKKAATRR
jgi:RNA polymerase sigma-70 factor (ECF subfamily)